MTSTTRRSPQRTHERGGFTLVELLLVVMLLGLLASVAVPRLNRSVRSRETTTTVRDFTALVESGRSEAVRRGLKVRLSYDPKKHEYWLSLQRPEHSNREEFGSFEDDFWDARRCFPQGMTLEGLGDSHELVFEPTGLAEERELRLVDASGGGTAVKVEEWFEHTSDGAPR